MIGLFYTSHLSSKFQIFTETTSIHYIMHWNISQKIAFRFFAVYIFLYTMSYQFVASALFDKLWRLIVPWFAKHILQLENEITVFLTAFFKEPGSLRTYFSLVRVGNHQTSKVHFSSHKKKGRKRNKIGTNHHKKIFQALR